MVSILCIHLQYKNTCSNYCYVHPKNRDKYIPHCEKDIINSIESMQVTYIS
jgi:hypothetical protein